MKQQFQENRNAYLLLLGLLFVLLFAVYFFFYRPLAGELIRKENQEQALTSDIAVLEAKIVVSEEDEVNVLEDIDRVRYEPQIPSKQKLDELILILNEIELVSDSSVSSISFGYSGSLPERLVPTEEEQIESKIEEGSIVEELEDEIEERYEIETETENLEASLQLIERPTGLEPITVTLNVESPDYEHFQVFLKEIEKQERKMVVSSLNFTKPAENELILSEDPDKSISATVSVMTFYFNE